MNNKNQSYSILIFEDDIDLARQWMLTLRNEGLTINHALTVEEALAYCASTQYDAVVSDIFLHDATGKPLPRGGYTLINYLRNTGLKKMPEWYATVPIVAVTGSPIIQGFDALALAKGMGATALMRKPFKPIDLVEKLVAILEGQEA